MGMDVHGLNPIENRKKSDFPILVKVDKLEKEEKWKERMELIEQSDNYHKERNEYENANKGIYFRNNCWYWRPLWDFCYNVAPELISDDLWADGHHNSGDGLNGEDAKLLGEKLLKAVSYGFAKKFKEHHEDQEKDIEDYKYPFDIENVVDFAEFCIESGGFEIC